MNILPSEQAAVVGAIDPGAYDPGTVTSPWVDMKAWRAIQAIILAGALGDAATLDAKLEQATDPSGAGAKDIAGKAIAGLTDAGSGSDKQAVINCRGEELDMANGFNHVRLAITVYDVTSDVGALILGHGRRYGPASDYDAATVDQIVV